MKLYLVIGLLSLTSMTCVAAPSELPGHNTNTQRANCTMLSFVSFSLPAATWQSLISQSQRYPTQFVLRGLVNDSMKETIQAIRRIDPEGRLSVSIDPVAFERFHVTSVPSFALMDTRAERCTSEPGCDVLSQVDRVSGNISLRAVLYEVAAHNGPSQHCAEVLLQSDRGR